MNRSFIFLLCMASTAIHAITKQQDVLTTLESSNRLSRNPALPDLFIQIEHDHVHEGTSFPPFFTRSAGPANIHNPDVALQTLHGLIGAYAYHLHAYETEHNEIINFDKQLANLADELDSLNRNLHVIELIKTERLPLFSNELPTDGQSNITTNAKTLTAALRTLTDTDELRPLFKDEVKSCATSIFKKASQLKGEYACHRGLIISALQTYSTHFNQIISALFELHQAYLISHAEPILAVGFNINKTAQQRENQEFDIIGQRCVYECKVSIHKKTPEWSQAITKQHLKFIRNVDNTMLPEKTKTLLRDKPVMLCVAYKDARPAAYDADQVSAHKHGITIYDDNTQLFYSPQ